MRFFLIFIIITGWTTAALADKVYLKNGDKITGNIISDSTAYLTIETEAMGKLHITRSFVKGYRTDKELQTEAAKAADQVTWTRKVQIAASDTGGNTNENQASGEIKLNRKTGQDEATFKMTASTQGGRDRAEKRKFYGLLRYARSFGSRKQWYHFARIEGNRDTAANVRYRIVPAYGVGYWFADKDRFKAMVEGAFGWERTYYEDDTASKSETVFTPRGYLEKTFENGLKFSEDITLYPSLEEVSALRLRSETKLSGKITAQLSWILDFLNEYDAQPAAERKKYDYTVSTGIEYAF